MEKALARRDSSHDTDSEAYRELLSVSQRRTGAIPPELLVQQVLDVTDGSDWPVQRAAMEALLRRIGFARRDQLVIAARPGGRAIFGLYQTRRKGSKTRPYNTLVSSLDPPTGSCDCPDYLRGSLGLW